MDRPSNDAATAEERRVLESRDRTKNWKRWGPYLAERAWGTVREDYSADGSAWSYLDHDDARSKAYRWNEDGIAGLCDRDQFICIAHAFWNGQDPILKERLFGLSGPQGNHGEDVKEYYYYLDSTPTHSYLKFLYKYPQREFPYRQLYDENRRRSVEEPEFELVDTGIFDESRYFDIFVEYAKADVEDILIRLTVVNRGPDVASLHVLPTIWFRNTWTWFYGAERPRLTAVGPDDESVPAIRLEHAKYGERFLYVEGADDILVTENETNRQRLFASANPTEFVKDGINDYVVSDDKLAVNSERTGTKAAAHYRLRLEPGASTSLRLRFCESRAVAETSLYGEAFDHVFDERVREADEFYATVIPEELEEDGKRLMRQAFAGLMWSKQFYHYIVKQWLEGDPAMPEPPPERMRGRNSDWTHLYNDDVLSVPDTWEYPWYASWDLAFHCVAISLIDPDFAKEQLILLLREWYMHPNGQLPAYEWSLGDVNPPVHAWAAYRVYKIEQKRRGRGDTEFLERVFHKLLLNFTWWVNRKDADGRNIFQGGFLGLDNIGLFDRSRPLPLGGHLEQSDGTSWMAMFCLNLLAIAMELSQYHAAYEDVASKFWEHFLHIAHAMSHRGDDSLSLWDDEDRFFYDVLHLETGESIPLKVRSMVGLMPLFAVETLEPEPLAHLTGFKRRLEWFIDNRPDLTANVACMRTPGRGERRLLSIVDKERLRRVLAVMLDEREFLSPFGIRSLSKYHEEHPFTLELDGERHRVDYEPAEATSGFFGGNSNWRGPVWFPVNYLIIESLQKYHHYYGDEFVVECPTGSGRMVTLWEVAKDLSTRLARLFLRDANGERPVYGDVDLFQRDPHFRDHVLFYEYFHGDNGAGLGASHQTGWTGLIAKLLQQNLT